MKSRHASALVALIAVGAACKTRPEPKPVPPIAASGSAADPWSKPTKLDPLPHPLLWAVEKAGKTTYFLGTMHIGVDPETRLPPLVWDKLDAATTFAMETDLSDPALAGMGQRHDGATVHQALGDAYWRKLQAALTPTIAERIDAMKPMVAATMLSLRGLPVTAPMDGVLLARATNAHKAIVFLEPAAKEEAILEKWMDVRALEEMLDDLPTGDQRSKATLDAYLAGDDQKILAMSDSERGDFTKHGRTDAEYDQMMNELLYERNAAWIPAIEQLHGSGGGFVAVGAMHLIGKRSVLDLLAQKGYKVTRLTP